MTVVTVLVTQLGLLHVDLYHREWPCSKSHIRLHTVTPHLLTWSVKCSLSYSYFKLLLGLKLFHNMNCQLNCDDLSQILCFNCQTFCNKTHVIEMSDNCHSLLWVCHIHYILSSLLYTAWYGIVNYLFSKHDIYSIYSDSPILLDLSALDGGFSQYHTSHHYRYIPDTHFSLSIW